MSDYRYCPQCGAGLVRREAGGLMRPTCPDDVCGFVLWDNPVPVVAALVEYGGRMLLARNVAWPEKAFGLVTGFLERDETPDQAVAREVAEELGLAATAVDLIGLYPFPQKNQLLIAYHVVAAGEIALNEELAEIRLIEPERLKAWDYGTGFAVRDWLAARAAG
ncbi:NUDIX domain-containing protein [Dechloromonas sp. H13]|uniref:NUDIX domain-containing protein n=1 Tax=Dechloromonas sp. H13 TaxID=2570193 RepID=UPI001D18F539|nr:NUDIX domain-containing protein [Dechloromonas sp. H13]